MGQWFRKAFVILITIITFGTVTPSHAIFHPYDENKQPKRDVHEQSPSSAVEVKNVQVDNKKLVEKSVQEQFIGKMMEQAEVKSYHKFGSKIKPVIENEFRDVILPNIEKAIEEVAMESPEEQLPFLQITKIPNRRNGEMIFHITNMETKKDVIRFHVRRDHPPQQGYWFNFHYHTNKDQFQTHHHLGSIYWDNNTPPNWHS